MLQKFPKEDIPAEVKEQMDFLYERSDVISRDATRHLATIAMDEGNFPLAEYYLDQTDKQQNASSWPKDAVKFSTTMARGRVAEAAGNLSKALKNYQSVKGAEQDEATLRVKRIESQLSSEKQQ
jgi:cation transport regulator ChaC